MTRNAKFICHLLECARIRQAPEKHHHTYIRSILMAMCADNIIVQIHGLHEALKVRQTKPETRFEMRFMPKPKTIIAASWMKALRRIKLARPETIEIMFAEHYYNSGGKKRGKSAAVSPAGGVQQLKQHHALEIPYIFS